VHNTLHPIEEDFSEEEDIQHSQAKEAEEPKRENVRQP